MITRRVQFAETDLAGVMYFANYFRMMEEVEHAFFRSIGTSVCITDQGRQLGWPRVKVSCEYFAPLRFEDEVELRLKIIDVSKRSLTHQVEFVLVGRGGESEGSSPTRGDATLGRCVARAQAKIACCTVEAGVLASTPIPEFIRSRIDWPGAAD